MIRLDWVLIAPVVVPALAFEAEAGGAVVAAAEFDDVGAEFTQLRPVDVGQDGEWWCYGLATPSRTLACDSGEKQPKLRSEPDFRLRPTSFRPHALRRGLGCKLPC